MEKKSVDGGRISPGTGSVKRHVKDDGHPVNDEITANNISLSSGSASKCNSAQNNVSGKSNYSGTGSGNGCRKNVKPQMPPRKLSLVSNCTMPLPPLSPCFIEVLDETDANNILYDLFKQVDTDNSGFIGIEEVIDICSKFGSSEEESNLIFKHLDKDGDGLISFEDFTAGFNEYKMQLMYLQPFMDKNNENIRDSWGHSNGVSISPSSDTASMDSATSTANGISFNGSRRITNSNRNHDMSRPAQHNNGNILDPKGSQQQKSNGKLDDQSSNISSDKSADNYRGTDRINDSFHQSSDIIIDNSSSTPSDSLLESLMDKVNRLKEENQLLTASLIKDRKIHSSHMTQLEQEVECQVKEVQERAVEMVKSELAAERKSLRTLLQDELDELHKQIQYYQKVDSLQKAKASENEALSSEMQKYINKLDELNEENRKLKYSLMDAQTNLAILSSDLAQLRLQYDEKASELSREKEIVALSMSQQDQLSRQLCLLQEANERLQDANDQVRISMITQHGSAPDSLIDIENKNTNIINHSASSTPIVSNIKRGSVLADYILPMNKSLDENLHSRKPNGNLISEYTSTAASDDGNCSLCSSSHASSSSCCSCSNSKSNASLKRRKRKSKSSILTETTLNSITSSFLVDEGDKLKSDDTSIPKSNNIQCKLPPKTLKNLALHPSSCSSMFESSTTSSNSSITPSLPPNVPNYSSPERTFKIILVGDAGVGKSSLIVRITKSKFDPVLSSTLGVDFHVKSLVVNGQSVLLQLWDTAGQERFRCMTRSYFRKVDGILLMYDVSNEKSFMSVRSWMVDIKSNATSPTTITGESIDIPVILIGNKVDLRESARPETNSLFISSDAGSIAAHEYGATAFAEISVKSGDYVDHALTALVVKMMATEDTLIKSNCARDSSVLSLSGRSTSWKDRMSCCSR